MRIHSLVLMRAQLEVTNAVLDTLPFDEAFALGL